MSPSVKMQLFLRAQNTHTLEVTGEETVGAIKVKKKTCPQCAVMCWASAAVIVHRAPVLNSSSLCTSGPRTGS